MDSLTTRKFLVSMVILILASFMLWFGKVDQSIWKEIVAWIFTVFVAGNAIDKVTGIFKKNE